MCTGLEEGGGAHVDAVVSKALEQPARYVLKPQREGGGNNLYEGELREALTTMSPAERASFIISATLKLQHLVCPPTEGLYNAGETADKM